MPGGAIGRKLKKSYRAQFSIADQQQVPPDFHCRLLADYARVLRKNHHRREARSVEARAAAERGYRAADVLVDVSEFSSEDGRK